MTRGGWTSANLGEAVAAGVTRFARGDFALLPLRQRWGALVGAYLSERVRPESLESGCLRIRVADPACRRAVKSLLPEIERKIRSEFPGVRSVSVL